MEQGIWQEQLWPDELYGNLQLSEDRCMIRLWHIPPGSEGDQIRCKLFRTTLLASPPYEALSYTWGDSHERRTIHVNGIDMLVTVNLELALRHLRNHKSRRTVWIDALCINQHDKAERSSQVQEMGNIYNFAERVLIWLGLPTSTNELAAEHIRQLADPQPGSRPLANNQYMQKRKNDAVYELLAAP